MQRVDPDLTPYWLCGYSGNHLAVHFPTRLRPHERKYYCPSRAMPISMHKKTLLLAQGPRLTCSTVFRTGSSNFCRYMDPILSGQWHSFAAMLGTALEVIRSHHFLAATAQPISPPTATTQQIFADRGKARSRLLAHRSTPEW